MLDKVLGRAELKERIAELEEEKHHLERRVEAEEERRADAVADRQRAEERVNRLEDRITELEDRVERLQGDEADLAFRRVETVRGERAADLLTRIRSVETGPEGALTAFVRDADSVPEDVTELFGEHAALVRRAAPALVVGDDAGVVSAAVDLPIEPDTFCEWSDGFRVEERWLRPTGRFAFGLVRADTFALGIYEGDERLSVEGFESEVKEAHSKGGFSQGRFERRREGQIENHLTKVNGALDDVDDVDRTILVGDRRVLSTLRDEADVTDVTDASGDPESALDHAFHDFWTLRVYAI